MKPIILVLLYISIVICVEIKLPFGRVIGGEEIVDQVRVEKFLNVPYALPPVGSLRLLPPVEWDLEYEDGVYDATVFGPGCVHDLTGHVYLPFGVSEDCLTLAVYKPAGDVHGLPVFVYFANGGGFDSAASQAFPLLFNGATLISKTKDVVVVVVQMRLGVLGNLYLDELNEETSGKAGGYGIRDTQEALRWIQKYISNFGGDPNLVMIVGNSGGANIVAQHLVLSESKGLFSAVAYHSGTIGLSGSSINIKKALEMGQRFKIYSGCHTGNDAAVRDCIRSLPVDVFVDYLQRDMHFPPVTGSDLFPTLPIRAIRTGSFQSDIPVLIGHTTDELGYMCNILPDDGDNYGTSIEYENNLPSLLREYFIGESIEYFNSLMQRVFIKFPPSSCNNTKEFACCKLADNIINDWAIRCPVRRLTRSIQQRNDNIFSFNFDQPIYCPDGLSDKGAFQTSDIPWLFGAEGSYFQSRTMTNCTWTVQEHEFSKSIITDWVNFAKTKSPRQDNTWLPYSPENNYPYMNLKKENIQLLHNVRPESDCDFWDIENEYLLEMYFPVSPTTTDIPITTTEAELPTETELTTEVNVITSESHHDDSTAESDYTEYTDYTTELLTETEIATETTEIELNTELVDRWNMIITVSLLVICLITFIVAVIIVIACPVRKKFYY